VETILTDLKSIDSNPPESLERLQLTMGSWQAETRHGSGCPQGDQGAQESEGVGW
jgi:hypothetical protein